MFHSSRKEMAELKKAGRVLTEKPESVQDILEVLRISPSGIMEVSQGLYTKSYLIDDANYSTLTYEEQRAFFLSWNKAINALDIQFKITYFNKLQNMEEFRKKYLYQHKGDVLDGAREAFNDIIEAKLLEGKHGIEQIKIFTICVNRNNYEEAKNLISSIETGMFKNFASLTSSLLPLNANERLELLYNFYHIGEEEHFRTDIMECLRSGRDWRNDVICNSIDFKTHNDYFRTDKKYCKAMYISPEHYPSAISDEFIIKLVNFNEPSIFTVDYTPVSQTVLKKVLDIKYMGIESDISRQQQKRNKNNDFASEISYKLRRQKTEIEEMMDDVRDNDQKMFWIGTSYVLIADDKKSLDNAVSSVNLVLEHAGFQSDTYVMRQREGLNTVLPIGVRQVDRMRGLLTLSAGAFLPFFAKDICMEEGSFFYGVNQLSKRIIMGNRKSNQLKNASGFVFGVPGSGKSFTGSKLEIGQVIIGTNDDIIVIDPTHEYLDIVNAFGGAFICLASYADTFFNPLDIDLEICKNRKEFNDIKAEKSQLFMGICCQCMGDEFQSGHFSIVDRCIRKLFDNLLLQPEEERRVPIMSDFKEILDSQPEPQAQEISLAMERFIDGSLNIFNHQTNTDIDNRIVVYGCRDMGEELMNISMVIMLENITNKILSNMKKGRTTWLYVDEFHVFLENPYTRDYFITLWKKIRKVGGIPTGITQNPSVILDDAKMASLLVNSEYTMILKDDGQDAQRLVENFDFMSGAMTKYITNADKGTGLIRFGNVVVPFDARIDKENPIYDIYNTNFHEKAAMQKTLDKQEWDMAKDVD